MKKETVIRTIVLFAALINQILTALGKNPLPYSDEQLYGAVTAAATVCATVWAWWKNNSFTKNAIQADAYLAELKAAKKEQD